MDTTHLKNEISRLWSDKEDEKERHDLNDVVDMLSRSILGIDFATLYHNTRSARLAVSGMRSHYRDGYEILKTAEKRIRAKLDIEYSAQKNPDTGKAFTRGAVEARLEVDENVAVEVDNKNRVLARVNLLRDLMDELDNYFVEIKEANDDYRQSQRMNT